MKIIPYVLTAVLGALAAGALGQLKEEYGLLAGLVTGCLLLGALLEPAGALHVGLAELFDRWGIPWEYGKTLLRMAGISLAADFGAQTCRDAGSGGLAMKLELCGRVLLCAEGLPLAMTLLSAGTSLLEEAL